MSSFILRAFFVLLHFALISSALGEGVSTHTATIYAWPINAANPSVLAEISYNPATLQSSLAKYEAPDVKSFAEYGDLVRIGFYKAGSEQWIGTVMGTDNLQEEVEKTIILSIDESGSLLQTSLRTVLQPKGDLSARERVSVEVVRPAVASYPHLNKPVVLDENGRVSTDEPEKTFLQKYWWILLLGTVLALAGGGDK